MHWRVNKYIVLLPTPMRYNLRVGSSLSSTHVCVSFLWWLISFLVTDEAWAFCCHSNFISNLIFSYPNAYSWSEHVVIFLHEYKFLQFFGIVINTVFSNCEMSVGKCLVMVFLNLYAMVPIVWQCVRINFDATSTEIDLKVEGRHWYSDHVHLTNVNLLSWEQFACFIVVIMHINVFKRWLFNFTRRYF